MDEVEALAAASPNLYSFLSGYKAESVLACEHLGHPEITDMGKPRDHDRARRGDRLIAYRGEHLLLELKSLEAGSIRIDQVTGALSAWAQVIASGSREVSTPDGSRLRHSHVLVDSMDLLAVSLHGFGCGWRFAFAPARLLERTTNPRLPASARPHLLRCRQRVTLPLKPPWSEELAEAAELQLELPPPASKVVTAQRRGPDLRPQ